MKKASRQALRFCRNQSRNCSGRVKTRCLYSTSSSWLKEVSTHLSVATFPQDDSEIYRYGTFLRPHLGQLYSWYPKPFRHKSILATFQTISHLRSNMLAVQNRSHAPRQRKIRRIDMFLLLSISIFIVWRVQHDSVNNNCSEAAYVLTQEFQFISEYGVIERYIVTFS